MEKSKRGAKNNSAQVIMILVGIIIVLLAVLGAVVFTMQVKSQEPKVVLSDGIIPYDVVNEDPVACSPLQREYHDPVIVNSDSNSGGAAGAAPMTGGGGASIVATSVNTMNSNSSAPLVATGTSVATMNTVTPFSQPTMGGPATYTPMPTQVPYGTPAPQNPANQPNANSAAGANPINTELNARMSAGEIDDNDLWNVYMTYRRNFAESPANASPVDNVDVSDRQLIRVVNAEGEPILGALVDILTTDNRLIQSNCTYATGYTMFFPGLKPKADDQDEFRVRAGKNGIQTEATLELSDNEWTLTLDVEQDDPNLDILFLIDATGSMDDEIAQLTNNILYISEQIRALPDEINVRYGLVSYKDGSFPTQVWDFTHDVNQFQSQLAQLYTAGGNGETLNDGLDRALHAVQWRGDDTVKLIFLVGDEPPGVYEDHPSYAITMMLAGQAGIKVHPIASSGLDVQGEYIFRQIAQATMGHFIFLTYANGQTAVQGGDAVSGSAGNEDFGEYSVEQLHEIVLNLIEDELSVLADNN